jgi:hypothetical protein
MEVAILLIVIAMQAAVGALDAQQDLAERLAWRQRDVNELQLQGFGFFLAAALFAILAWFDTVRLTVRLACRGSRLAGVPVRSGWARALRDLCLVESKER